MLKDWQGDPPTNFNPRSRKGSDGTPRRDQPFTPISIHAPVKGATDG